MARRKLARRFEPRGGVSQSMVEAEARYVARELEDYLLLSIKDLRQKLAERHRKTADLETHLQSVFSALPDRERLALRTLRGDFRHLPSLHDMRAEPDELSRFEGEGGPANDADENKLEPREAVRQVIQATAG